MKKTVFTAAAMMLLGMGAYAQSPQWIMGSSLIPFTGSGPGTPTTLTGAAGYSTGANAAFDANGNLLFYVRGDKVYNSSNTLVGSLSTYYYGKEISIVNVPNTCDQFYIITMSPYSTCIGCSNHMQYNKVTVSGSSITVGAALSLSYTGAGAFAVSKLRADKTRFLFYVGQTVERFVISNTGITHAQTIMSSAGTQVSDVELYEDASGNMRLAWGDNYVGLQIVTLNSSGNYSTNYVPGISGLNNVNGVEFINYNEILIAQDNSNASQKGLAKVSFGGSLAVTFIPGTSAYYNSYIEKALDGKFYATKPVVVGGTTQYKLSSINYSSSTVTEVQTLADVDISNSIRVLPDQIDNEDYYNANYRADLMSRDGLDDLGLEPNPSNDIWASPDIWNRRNGLGNPNDNQEPGYAGGGNLMKVRIKNRGCVASQQSYVKMYWTLGATQERWPASWNGSTFINGTVAGEEIKTAGLGYADYVILGGVDKGYEVPALAPGQEVIITAKWYPPDPATYNDPTRIGANAMICFLGRIDDPVQDPMYSELSSATTSTGRNIKYNNNIVTRNSNLTNMSGSYLVVPGGGTVLVGNYFQEAALFNVRFRALTSDDVTFSDIGKVTLRMDDNLWNAWMASGFAGEGVEVSDYENHVATVANLDNAVLRNINMPPGQLMGIGSYFSLAQTTDIQKTYSFIISQEKTDASDDEEQYGSQCVFIVAVNGENQGDDGTGADPGGGTGPAGPAQPLSKVIHLDGKGQVELFPNPNTGISQLKFGMAEEGEVSIQILDINGRVLKSIISNQKLAGGIHMVNISSEGLANGTYMLQLITPKAHTLKQMNVMRH